MFVQKTLKPQEQKAFFSGVASTHSSLTKVGQGAILTLMAVLLTSMAQAVDLKRAQEIATTVCVACHMADGNSVVPTFPVLAGQHAGYLQKQMKDFKAQGANQPSRVNAIMNPQMLAFSESDLDSLAVYFSQQKANKLATAPADPAAMAMAQNLYKKGDANRGIAACAGCHGPQGLGADKQYPRIAGQQAEYTKATLTAFRTGERANDPAEMMRKNAATLSDKEIAALADYLAVLGQ